MTPIATISSASRRTFATPMRRPVAVARIDRLQRRFAAALHDQRGDAERQQHGGGEQARQRIDRHRQSYRQRRTGNEGHFIQHGFQ